MELKEVNLTTLNSKIKTIASLLMIELYQYQDISLNE